MQLDLCRRYSHNHIFIAILVIVISVKMASSHAEREEIQMSKGDDQMPTDLHDAKLVHDRQHLKEHYEGVASLNESDMNEGDLEFHHFAQHDLNKDTKLDGLEIYYSVQHVLPYKETKNPASRGTLEEEDAFKMRGHQYYVDIVDKALKSHDIDNDGYLTYAEYSYGNSKARNEAREEVKTRQQL